MEKSGGVRVRELGLGVAGRRSEAEAMDRAVEIEERRRGW